MDQKSKPIEELVTQLSALRVSNAVLLKHVIEARDYMRLTHFRPEVISRFDAAIKEAHKIQVLCSDP